jgi:prevent-host-death family protein
VAGLRPALHLDHAPPGRRDRRPLAGRLAPRPASAPRRSTPSAHTLLPFAAILRLDCDEDGGAKGKTTNDGETTVAAKTVTIEEAQGHLDELIEKAHAGDEVILAKGGEPVAKLVPLAKRKSRRVFGQCKGEIWTSDDFDDPLPDDFWLGGNP